MNDDLFPDYMDDELNSIPHPTWLVDGLIATNQLSLIYAPRSVGKTFFALDMSMCISQGLPFHGRPTKKGSVVYVYSEGGSGARKRVNAWKMEQGISPEQRCGVLFITRSVNMLDEREVTKLIQTIEKRFDAIELLNLDTLARCFGSGNENETSDMNLFTQNCDLLRNHFDANVCVVHHTGHNQSRERGNSSIGNNFDTVLSLKRKPKTSRIIITGEKQKDDAGDKDFSLDMTVVEMPDGTTSCVLRGNAVTEYKPTAKVDKTAMKILEALSDFKSGATHTQWEAHILDLGICKSESTFGKKIDYLNEHHHLIKKGRIYTPAEPIDDDSSL